MLFSDYEIKQLSIQCYSKTLKSAFETVLTNSLLSDELFRLSDVIYGSWRF